MHSGENLRQIYYMCIRSSARLCVFCKSLLIRDFKDGGGSVVTAASDFLKERMVAKQMNKYDLTKAKGQLDLTLPLQMES